MVVRPGWKEGTKVTFNGKGDERPGQPADDLVLVIKQAPHPRFTRNGNDCESEGGGCIHSGAFAYPCNHVRSCIEASMPACLLERTPFGLCIQPACMLVARVLMPAEQPCLSTISTSQPFSTLSACPPCLMHTPAPCPLTYTCMQWR